MEQTAPYAWPLWYRILFRFLFIYFALYLFAYPVFDFVSPFSMLDDIPQLVNDFSVRAFNTHVLKYKDELVPLGGSGDTSFGWAQLAFQLTVAAIGCVIWSVIDRKRKTYYRAEYFMRTAIRYFIALIAFMYGNIKIMALQMPEPTLSQLATPLGDFLPMRFSWLFIGYSTPYQIFSGVMELIVCILLLYRRTVTLGLVVGLGVFVNVMMLNLFYDVPVKIFSIHLVVMCALLLLNDAKRLVAIFVLNKPAEANQLYHYQPAKKSSKVIRIALKCFFIFMAIWSTVELFPWYLQQGAEKVVKPISYGHYDVVRFARNGHEVPVLAHDTIVWKDMIFEYDKNYPYISVASRDSLFQNQYGRGDFWYKADTINKQLLCYRYEGRDSLYLFTMKYEFRKNDTIRLNAIGKDSLDITIVKSNRKFPLAEKQFHWLSESNR